MSHKTNDSEPQTFLIPDYKVKQPKITIIERKLGRERADGQAFKDDGLIEVDPRQNAKSYLETVIHEWLHVQFPTWTEEDVTKVARKQSRYLWNLQYRRVYMK